MESCPCVDGITIGFGSLRQSFCEDKSNGKAVSRADLAGHVGLNGQVQSEAWRWCGCMQLSTLVVLIRNVTSSIWGRPGGHAKQSTNMRSTCRSADAITAAQSRSHQRNQGHSQFIAWPGSSNPMQLCCCCSPRNLLPQPAQEFACAGYDHAVNNPSTFLTKHQIKDCIRLVSYDCTVGFHTI